MGTVSDESIEGWQGPSLSASGPPPWASEEQPHWGPPWRPSASLMTRSMRWSRDLRGWARLALAPLVQHPFLVTVSPSFGAAALPSVRVCELWAENR